MPSERFSEVAHDVDEVERRLAYQSACSRKCVGPAATLRCMNRWTAAGAVVYAVIGVASALRPAKVPALFGSRADNAAARTEVRAVYGGLPLGIAASLAVSPRNSGAMAALSGAMAAGRAVSILVEDDEPSSMNLVFLGVESALAVILLLGDHRAQSFAQLDRTHASHHLRR